MTTPRKYAKLAILIPILWLVLSMTVFGTSCVGSANAQEPEKTDLEEVTAAFYLLKFDYDLLAAKHTSTVRADSLQLASVVGSYESMLQFERDKRKRDIWTIGITAVVTGTLFYLARTVD